MATNKEAIQNIGREHSGSDAVMENYEGINGNKRQSDERNAMDKECVQCNDIASRDGTSETDAVEGRRASCWKCTRKETSIGEQNDQQIFGVEMKPKMDNDNAAVDSDNYQGEEGKPRATSSAMTRDSYRNVNVESSRRHSDNVKLKRSVSVKGSVGRLEKSETIRHSGGITELCDSHAGKVMEYYCRNHSELLCSVCMSLNHNECTTKKCVEYIPNFVNIADVEKDLKDTISQIGEMTKLCQEHKNTTTQKISKVIDMFNTINDEIADFRKRVNERIDKLQNDILKETQNIRDKMTNNFMKQCDQFDTTIKNLRNLTFELHQCQETQNTAQSFVVLQKTEREIMKQKRGSGIKEDEALDEYFFDAEKKLEAVLHSVISFGSLRKRQRLKTVDIKQHGTINVRSKDDKKDSWVTGLVILSDSRIIAADCDNQMVKLIDSKNNLVLTTLRIPSRLHDVTALLDNQYAITLPAREKILVFSISEDELCVERAIKVKGKCYGIASIHDGQHFVVSFLEPAHLQILQVDGTLVRKIVNDASEMALFSCPEYISVSMDGTRIYVSDYDRDTLTVLSIEGQVRAVFRESTEENKLLEGPKAVFVSEDGFVYLCGCDSNNVLMFTNDLCKHSVLLTHVHGLQHPVCFGEVRQADTNVVFVTGGPGSNLLNVFKY